jgi:porin
MTFVRASLAALAIICAGTFGLASEPVPAQEESFFERERLTGGWAGVRKEWQDAGVDLGLTDIAETLSNPTGGIRQLAIYQGLLAASLNLDLEKIAMWPGASVYVDGYQISGRGLSKHAVGNLLAVSTIEALPSHASTICGWSWNSLTARPRFASTRSPFDDEFYISQYSANFVSSTFGCPDLLSTDLPSGGPCYPFATPGVRVRAAPATGLTISAAAFNGNPAPPGPGDPQVRNSSGTNFLIGEGGFLTIAEVAYSFDEEPISSLRLSDVKLGGWYHTAIFPDLRRDTSGHSLAEPTSTGIAARHSSNFGLYMIIDKMLWRRPDTATQGLAAFLRLGGAPADRNLISIEVDVGVTYKGLFPGRASDVLGVAASYDQIGGAARRFDREAILFTGIGRPVRDYEAVLEVSYQARISPWWMLQPDLQLIAHPGGNVAPPFPAPPARPIPNALVIGLRSSITF